jgi:hypothetical protein
MHRPEKSDQPRYSRLDEYSSEVSAQVTQPFRDIGIPDMPYDRLSENAMVLGALCTPSGMRPELGMMMVYKLAQRDEGFARMLMALPSDYIKLLAIYCNIDDTPDLLWLAKRHQEASAEISSAMDHDLTVKPGDPQHFVEFFGGFRLEGWFEFILNRAGVNSVRDFAKLFYDNPWFGPAVRELDFEIASNLILMADINDIDSMLELFRDERVIAMASGKIKSANLEAVIDHFSIVTMDRLLEFVDDDGARHLLESAPQSNVVYLLRISDISDGPEFYRLCGNKMIAENVDVSYEPLEAFVGAICTDVDVASSHAYRIITTSYTADISKSISSFLEVLGQGYTPPKKAARLILDTLNDRDYVEQNLGCIAAVAVDGCLKTNEDVDNFRGLMGVLGGFATPELAKQWLRAADDDARTQLYQRYQGMMGQVLGSGPIEGTDDPMTAEAVYLAYRPTGYSLARVAEMIRGWSLKDLSSQLEPHTFRPEGYEIQLLPYERQQEEAFDVEGLMAIDKLFVSGSDLVKLENSLPHLLSRKQVHQGCLTEMLAFILEQMKDDRYQDYSDDYFSIRRHYSVERLERLEELLTVLPKEEAFVKELEAYLSSDVSCGTNVIGSVERELWMTRKMTFGKPGRTCKARVDQILHHLDRDLDSDISQLLESEDLTFLDKEVADEIRGASNSTVQRVLKTVRAELFLGYDEGVVEDPDTRMAWVVRMLHTRLVQRAKALNVVVKRELKKVKSVRSEQMVPARCVVSKNVGSYFAKAGAELCTKNNMGMWKEPRHFHLNIIHDQQIIGNVMIYIEPGRDYLVVRGFNPRVDAMGQFDRRHLANELVRVCQIIAKDNGFTEIYAPEHTAWHALSNRQGMIKEIQSIGRRNRLAALADNPDQRVVIEDADFKVAEEYSSNTIERLELLALAA